MSNMERFVPQTLYVETGLCLCDCPGLVMPSFVSTKAEMVCCGILPVDQMRDHVPPVSLISFSQCHGSKASKFTSCKCVNYKRMCALRNATPLATHSRKKFYTGNN